MRNEIQDALDMLRGRTLEADEAHDLLLIIHVATIASRNNDYELDANLIYCGALLMRESGTHNKMKIARKWLIAFGIPADQLDELIVIAKLSRPM